MNIWQMLRAQKFWVMPGFANAEDRKLLEDWGMVFQALEKGFLSPSTPKQVEWVSQVRGQSPVTSRTAKLWLDYNQLMLLLRSNSTASQSQSDDAIYKYNPDELGDGEIADQIRREQNSRSFPASDWRGPGRAYFPGEDDSYV